MQSLRMRESTFWKWLASLLVAVLVALVLVDSLGIVTVPVQLRSFLFSALVCIGVGYSVVTPKSSPMLLDDQAERSARNKQLIVGLMISVVLGALLLTPEAREASLGWILVPVIALTPALIVREAIIRRRKR